MSLLIKIKKLYHLPETARFEQEARNDRSFYRKSELLDILEELEGQKSFEEFEVRE